MAEELRPCPLCGSTDIACFAEECGDSYDNVPTFRAVIGCLGCHEEGCDSTYDDEPCFGIEAYYRADNPLIMGCEDPEDCERVLERHMAERWNRRAELTCRVGCYPPGYEDNLHYEVCSECGTILTASRPGDRYAGRASYCPNCGARVVTE